MELAVITAFTKQGRVIGKNNKLIWNIPEDLARFKKLTSGHFCITGRKTFQTLPVLPSRTLVVLTSEKTENKENIFFVNNLKEAFNICRIHNPEKIFCIGGEKIYKLCLPFASIIYVTEVLKEYDGDAFFPAFKESDFIIEEEEYHSGFSFKTYKRKKPLQV